MPISVTSGWMLLITFAWQPLACANAPHRTPALNFLRERPFAGAGRHSAPLTPILTYSTPRRGADFYHTHHSRRISADDTHTSLERLIVRASGFFGGVEAMGRKMVAQARKQYAERPLSAGQMGERLVKLPMHIWPCAKLHVSKFYSVASHQLMKFVALNVIAKLYTKTPLSAEVAAVSQ